MIENSTTQSKLPAAQSKNRTIEAKNIHVKFGSRVVLNHIHLELFSGQVTALLGPNGAGKSTLLKVLSDEIPNQADITLFDTLRQDWPKAELAKHLGMLPQHSNLSFPFLAHEVVELGAIPLNLPTKQSREIAIKHMEQTDVSHLAQRVYPSLSGGEKQRLHLARVLTQLEHGDKQKILLLDEPTSALDLAHQHATLKIARRIADQEQATVVIVLHDLNLAAQYADRMVVLNNGAIVADGEPEQVMNTEMIADVYGYDAIVAPHPTLGFPVMYSRA